MNTPAPTRVYALNFSVYITAGINPLMVYVIVLVSVMFVEANDVLSELLYCSSYCVMMPLGVSGGVHNNVIDLD